MSHQQESQTIEVEVLAVDGISPARPHTPPDPPRRNDRWAAWRGRILHLDRRWWPLWVILGTIALVLLLTVGVFVAILLTLFTIVRGFLRALIR